MVLLFLSGFRHVTEAPCLHFTPSWLHSDLASHWHSVKLFTLNRKTPWPRLAWGQLPADSCRTAFSFSLSWCHILFGFFLSFCLFLLSLSNTILFLYVIFNLEFPRPYICIIFYILLHFFPLISLDWTTLYLKDGLKNYSSSVIDSTQNLLPRI